MGATWSATAPACRRAGEDNLNQLQLRADAPRRPSALRCAIRRRLTTSRTASLPFPRQRHTRTWKPAGAKAQGARRAAMAAAAAARQSLSKRETPRKRKPRRRPKMAPKTLLTGFVREEHRPKMVKGANLTVQECSPGLRAPWPET